MSSISGAFRSIGASSFRQITPGPSPSATRLRIRNLHQSPLTRRAPVPNPPRPATTTNGASTIGSTVVNGSRNGAGGSSGAGAGSGGKKKASAHALWYREIVPGKPFSPFYYKDIVRQKRVS